MNKLFRHLILLCLCLVGLSAYAQIDNSQAKIVEQAAYDLGTLCRKNFTVQIKSKELSDNLSKLISQKAAAATGLPIVLTIDSYNLQNKGDGNYSCKISLAPNTPQKQQLEQMANQQLAGTKFAQALGLFVFWPLKVFATTCVEKRASIKVVKYSNTHFIFEIGGLNLPGPGKLRVKTARYKLNRKTSRLDALVFETADASQIKLRYSYSGEGKEPVKISAQHSLKDTNINGIPLPPKFTDFDFVLENYKFQ